MATAKNKGKKDNKNSDDAKTEINIADY